MAVTFSEGRELPAEFTRGGGYEGYFGAAGGGSDAWAVESAIRSISPWDMLTGLFVTKPAQEHAARVEIARTQAQAQAQALTIRGANVRTMVWVGGALVALLAVGIVILKRKPAKVGGYRSRRKKNRSRR